MNHKEQWKKLTFVPADRRWMAVFSILVALLTAWVFFAEAAPEWKEYQSEFRTIIEEKFGEDRAASVPSGLQQVYVPALNATDRCVTCHQGVEWKGLERAPQPFTTHPKGILEKHPVAKYGCTPCHGGQGYATESEAAHGFVEHWEEPLLGKELTEFYVVSSKGALLQSQCNVCHRYEKSTPGAGMINRAKEIVSQRGCRACHVINGRGGTVGPDLTNVGAKSAEQYTYERIKGLPSSFAWHVAHLKNPKEIVPETVMPNFAFNTVDAQSLAMLMLSWRNTRLPVEYIPGHNFKDVPSTEELEKEKRMREGPGAFFVAKQCFVCHSVSTLGIDAAAQIGPDLALAVEDVQARFGRTLEDFLMKPTGTMEVVLATMIQLEKQERQEAVEKLKLAYELKKKERAVKK